MLAEAKAVAVLVDKVERVAVVMAVEGFGGGVGEGGCGVGECAVVPMFCG